MVAAYGADRNAVVARELTKAFEEIRPGTLASLAGHYAEAGAPKGEIVILVAPPLPAEAVDEAEIDRLLLSLAGEMAASRAAAEAARMTGRPKQALYRRLLELKAGDGRAE
jgi:16S rRNA (cytidine1402-2'-O)-methyltransferase